MVEIKNVFKTLRHKLIRLNLYNKFIKGEIFNEEENQVKRSSNPSYNKYADIGRSCACRAYINNRWQ